MMNATFLIIQNTITLWSLRKTLPKITINLLKHRSSIKFIAMPPPKPNNTTNTRRSNAGIYYRRYNSTSAILAIAMIDARVIIVHREGNAQTQHRLIEVFRLRLIFLFVERLRRRACGEVRRVILRGWVARVRGPKKVHVRAWK